MSYCNGACCAGVCFFTDDSDSTLVCCPPGAGFCGGTCCGPSNAGTACVTDYDNNDVTTCCARAQP